MAFFTSLKNYFFEAYEEMKKVSWPTRHQLKTYTLIVIGLSIGMALFFALLDYIFNFGLTLII